MRENDIESKQYIRETVTRQVTKSVATPLPPLFRRFVIRSKPGRNSDGGGGGL